MLLIGWLFKMLDRSIATEGFEVKLNELAAGKVRWHFSMIAHAAKGSVNAS